MFGPNTRVTLGFVSEPVRWPSEAVENPRFVGSDGLGGPSYKLDSAPFETKPSFHLLVAGGAAIAYLTVQTASTTMQLISFNGQVSRNGFHTRERSPSWVGQRYPTGSTMTAVLGVSAFYHDSAAALVVDGEIVAAAQEERFTRKKHDHDFPVNAIGYCLEEG